MLKTNSHNRPYLNPKSLFDTEGDMNKQPNEADVDRKHSVFPPRTDACFVLLITSSDS